MKLIPQISLQNTNTQSKNCLLAPRIQLHIQTAPLKVLRVWKAVDFDRIRHTPASYFILKSYPNPERVARSVDSCIWFEFLENNNDDCRFGTFSETQNEWRDRNFVPLQESISDLTWSGKGRELIITETGCRSRGLLMGIKGVISMSFSRSQPVE